MAAPKRSEEQRESDLVELSEMYLKGASQKVMAERFGVTRQQIQYDLADLRKRWRESALLNTHEERMKALERVDLLEAQAWDAWERSKRFRLTTVNSSSEGPTGEGKKEEVRKEDQVGDAQYLGRIAWCISERCKILGLYAAVKLQHGGDSSAPPIQHEVVTIEDIVAARQKVEQFRAGLINGPSSN